MPAEPTPTGTVLALIGEFDIAQRDRAKDAFAAVVTGPTLVLDLSRTTFMDSTVLTLLVAQRQEMLAQKRTLIIVGASKMVKRIFDLTSLSKVFDMRPTLDDLPGATDYHRVEVVADGD